MDTVFLALRVIVSLGAVFGALFFAHRWLTKGRGAGGGGLRGKAISVVSRQGLGTKAGVAIVDAGGRRYLLGVTEHAVTVLDRLGAADGETPAVSVVSTAPVPLVAPASAFERELHRASGMSTGVTGTGGVPVVVGPDAGPSGPPTQTISLPAHGRAAARPEPVQHTSRRAAREAEEARVVAERVRTAKPSPLAGSVLSPETWRQTAAALRRR
ncbi:MAG TPA: flagellar biosynthetic protein FliO [Amnibacterium sp.]|jgi:flagellar protein FliO/FliZ|uniref:flagellar biosynthetic protein FliO n=1 Tax=Amnibacterium sp. TaxID=1872496 RepID=UPI002F91F2B3